MLAGVTFTPDTIAIPVQLRRIKTIASVDFMANIGTAAATTCRLGSFLYWRRLFVYRLRGRLLFRLIFRGRHVFLVLIWGLLDGSILIIVNIGFFYWGGWLR